MIICRISGGLGNQMFEYAMGRALALRNHTELFLDLSAYRNNTVDTYRIFSLDKFNIDIRTATKEEYQHLGLPDMTSRHALAKAKRKLFRIAESFKPLSQRKFLIEPSFLFSAEAFNARDNTYVSGVWQSEKYFADETESIRQDFTLKKPLSGTGQEVLRIIQATPISASIHIRRGDYVTNPKFAAKIGACSPEYYQRATHALIEKFPSIQFFVFSDDIAYAHTIAIPGKPLFVSKPEIPDFEELFLMSACTHNIIANSSFSWWAAWLNRNPAKTIIAPNIWFKSNIPTVDLIPSSWLRL